MSTTRERETGPVPNHLSKDKPAKRGSNLSATKQREFWCNECLYRVSQASDGNREYGHKRDCSHHAVSPNGINRRDA